MDRLFSSLTLDQLSFVEDQLSNNEASSSKELHAHFIKHGLTKEQATQAIRYRPLYLSQIFITFSTPILLGDFAIRLSNGQHEYLRDHLDRLGIDRKRGEALDLDAIDKHFSPQRRSRRPRQR
jgi:hypothetical protein